jgi:hypothetical protein
MSAMSAYMTYLESFSAPMTPSQMLELGIINPKTYKKMTAQQKPVAEVLDQPSFAPKKRRILLKKKPVA